MNDRRPVGSGAPPNPKTVALIALAFALLLGAFLLGRATPPPVERADPVAIPTAAPATSVPTPTLAPATSDGLVADLSGTGDLLADVAFDEARKVVLLCRRSAAAGSGDRLFVSYLDTAAEPPQLLAHESIPQAVRCDDCQVRSFKLQGENVALGECPTVIVRGAFQPAMDTNLSFVLAVPPIGTDSAVGLLIDCGVTSLDVDLGDSGLVLRGRAPSPDSAAPPVLYPPVHFDRRDRRFHADDLWVLRHFCDTGGSEQLSGLVESGDRWVPRQGTLAYLETDSNVGTIGIRRQLLIALQREQCATLSQAQLDPTYAANGPTSLAEIVGVEPPDNTSDWYLTCQIVDK